MGRRHDFLRVLQGTQEGQSSDNCENYSCSDCFREDNCKWCSTAAKCQPSTSCSSTSGITNSSDCPHAGGTDVSVVWKNISVLIGAMLGLVICLNMINRCSNRRRSRKLKRSIFRLPVYTYPSRERRAAALRAARSILDASSRSTIDIEDGSSQGEEDSCVTCTICLASYEEEEVIKVLPCGHDFHAHCLDAWLELKASCPLCKTPAFSKKRRETPRRYSRESQINAVNTVATGSASGPGPGLAVADSPLADHQTTDGDIQSSGGDTDGVALVRTATCPEIGETVSFVEDAEDDVESMHRMENVRKNSIVAQGDHDEASSANVGPGDNRDHDLRHGEVERRMPVQESLTRSLVTRSEPQS